MIFLVRSNVAPEAPKQFHNCSTRNWVDSVTITCFVEQNMYLLGLGMQGMAIQALTSTSSLIRAIPCYFALMLYSNLTMSFDYVHFQIEIHIALLMD